MSTVDPNPSGNEPDLLRSRLEALLQKTHTAAQLPSGGFWVGDVAGERQVSDDIAAGRLNWRTAHRFAASGLQALDADNLELSQIYAWAATDLYVAALEARVRPSDLQVLGKAAKRRGRPAK